MSTAEFVVRSSARITDHGDGSGSRSTDNGCPCHVRILSGASANKAFGPEDGVVMRSSPRRLGAGSGSNDNAGLCPRTFASAGAVPS